MGIAVPGVAVGTWALWGISAASGVSAGIRSKRMRDKSGAALLHRDHGSRAIIVFGTYVLIAAEFVLRFNRIGWVSGPWLLAGQLIVLVGIALRYWALMVLGRFYTTAVAVQGEQTLVQRGPYRIIRHPSYSGGLLILFGFGFALNTWVGAVIAVIVLSAMYAYRIAVEEKVMLETFGDDYRDYMRRTRRLFPGVW